MTTNATAEKVNLLLGLSRNDHMAMLDVLHDYFNTHNEDIFKYYVMHACFSPRKRLLSREDESTDWKFPCHVMRSLTLCFVMDHCSRVILSKNKVSTSMYI